MSAKARYLRTSLSLPGSSLLSIVPVRMTPTYPAPSACHWGITCANLSTLNATCQCDERLAAQRVTSRLEGSGQRNGHRSTKLMTPVAAWVETLPTASCPFCVYDFFGQCRSSQKSRHPLCCILTAWGFSNKVKDNCIVRLKPVNGVCCWFSWQSMSADWELLHKAFLICAFMTRLECSRVEWCPYQSFS